MFKVGDIISFNITLNYRRKRLGYKRVSTGKIVAICSRKKCVKIEKNNKWTGFILIKDIRHKL